MLLVLGALLGLTLLITPIGRLLLVLTGAIGSLQATEGTSTAKLGFLALLVLCGVIATARMPGILRDPRLRAFRWVPLTSMALAAYLLASQQIAAANGNDFTAWARDVIAYLILAVAPLVGLDVAAGSSVRAVVRIILILGVVSTAAFTVTWLGRRGYQLAGQDSLALASMPLCVLPFAYALARGFLGPQRWRWLSFAIAIPLLLLTTGTRTAIVFVLGLLGLVGRSSKRRVSPLRAVLGGLIACVAIAVLLPHVATTLTADPQFLSRRFGSIQALLSRGGSSDESYLQRSLAYHYADVAWQQHFWLGTGPGHYFPPIARGKDPSLQVDTPVTLLSKFGVVGAAIIVGYLVAIISAVFRTRAITGYTTELTATRVSVFVMLALAPFASLLDDKGVGLSLMVLIALTGARAMQAPSGEVTEVHPDDLVSEESPVSVAADKYQSDHSRLAVSDHAPTRRNSC